MTFNEIRLQAVDFLNTKVIGNQIYLDLWHIIHFFAGGIIMFFILKFFKEWKKERMFAVLFILLVLYEFFELSFIVSGSSFFREESASNVFLDLALGFLGGFWIFKVKNRKS